VTAVRDIADADLADVRARVAARVVGRDRELDLLLAAVAAGRDVLLEGPAGTSKSTILAAITAEWDVPLVFVEGNADLTPTRLVGHHSPARVLREDYTAATFVPGPLVEAMRSGGFLYVEEFDRAPRTPSTRAHVRKAGLRALARRWRRPRSRSRPSRSSPRTRGPGR